MPFKYPDGRLFFVRSIEGEIMNLINEQSVATSAQYSSEELSQPQVRVKSSSLELSSSVIVESSLSSSSTASSFALVCSSVESINRQIENCSNKISFGGANQINLISKMPITTTTKQPSAGCKATAAVATTNVSLSLSTLSASFQPATTDVGAVRTESITTSTTMIRPSSTTTVDIDNINDVSDSIKHKKNGESSESPTAATTTQPSAPPDKQRKIGCEHYKRRAMFVTPCCNRFYKCRYCHDENETHHFDRKSLTELICVECNTRQKVQEKCENCGVRFGKYTCLICNLFDDEDKNQYHCDGCGICRIGGRKNFFHCEVCNMCLPIELKIEGHRCVENISRSNCPVCLGAIHTSRIPCHIPDCGHLLHKMCFDQLLASGHYVCPTCQTSLLDMTRMWEYLDAQALLMAVPKKYENQRVYIFCNDCHETCKTKFHFVGLKCIHCGGYNTTQDVKRRMSWVNGADSSTSA